MANPLPLADALEQYRQALNDLDSLTDNPVPTKLASTPDPTQGAKSSPDGTPETANAIAQPNILDVLTARDTVQVSLSTATSISAADWITVRDLDQRLKRLGSFIAGGINLAEWRSLTQPPEQAWWWQFEAEPRIPWLEQNFKWLNRFDALWTFLTLCFLTIAVTLLLNTITRFVEGGLDSFGTIAVVIQAVLTVVGGTATLTQRGRQWVEAGVLRRLRIPKTFWQECSVLVSLLVLLLVFSIYQFVLPQVAQVLHQRGLKTHYQQNHFDSARQYYQQAIALQPNFAEARYNLGVLNEDLQKLDEAATQYEIVVQSNLEELKNLTKLRAHNNLGRIYILREQYREAWTPLETALSFVQQKDPDTYQDPLDPDATWEEVLYEKYNILKNLGWLRVGQQHFIEAEGYLREAIAIGQNLGETLASDAELRDKLDRQGQPGSAYCLEAKALEGLQQNEAALAFWENCLRYGVISNPDEAKWIAVARERVSGLVSAEPTT